jgi:hypothetical protein
MRLRYGIFKILWSPGIDSDRIYSLAGWYDKSISTRFLAPIDCLKITAQATKAGRLGSLESVPGLLKSLQIQGLGMTAGPLHQ